MNWPEDSLLEIARRRARLLARASAQRAAIAGAVHELEAPAAIADRALSVARFMRLHPVVSAAAAATAALALQRPGVLSFAGRALAVWRLWRTVASVSSRRAA